MEEKDDSPPLLSELLPLCGCCEDDSGDHHDDGGRAAAADVSSSSSLNMWGDCRPSNYAKAVRRARLFKPARLALFARAKAALEAAGVEYALYGGSALAVHREAGRMIAHDSDIDLVIREADFARLVAIGNELARTGLVSCDAACAMTGRTWLQPSGRHLPYDGRGCKRLKLALTAAGWEAVGLRRPRLAYDPCLVHLDVFTVSPHPLDPAGSLRVNWAVPGLYDPLAKRFPSDCLFPVSSCCFEGLATFAPRDLVAYLTVEYGYLGRDAVYDAATGLYVKMPPELLARMPRAARVRLAEPLDYGGHPGEEDEKADAV